jgi:hypothetical protein
MSTTEIQPIPDEIISQDKAQSLQVIPTIEEPEEDDRSIQAIALPKTASPTSPLNGYMLFCTLVVGFGGLCWGCVLYKRLALYRQYADYISSRYENALVGPVSAMTAFVAHVQGANPQTGLFVLTATNQSILFSVPLTGTVVGRLPRSSMVAAKSLSFFCRLALLHPHPFNHALVASGLLLARTASALVPSSSSSLLPTFPPLLLVDGGMLSAMALPWPSLRTTWLI